MAFITDCDQDVFVSYAHLDNQGETPWVTMLAHHIDTEVRQRLGSKEFRIWIDHNLDGNRPLDPEIFQAIQRSAILLVVMSPGYLSSEWCAKERNTFLKFANDCVNQGRIFIVHCRETDRKRIPSEFGQLVGFKFWKEDPDAGGAIRPLGLSDWKEPSYVANVINLSDRLARTLNDIKTNKKPGVRSGTSENGEHVFLARSTDDMENREEELVGYLTQAGLGILPRTWYPEDTEGAFHAAMKTDLERCLAFVQLLGKLPGRQAAFAGGRRYPQLQYEIAATTGKPILQWRESSDDPNSILDEAHRALVESARACGFEEFKRTVVETVRPRLTLPERRKTTLVTVFVNADRADLEVAQGLSQLLANQGVECYWPILEGSPEKVRQDLEANLTDCDGLVMIYGASEPSWVRDQLRQGRKVLGQRAKRLAALAIYLGPPPLKPELAMALPGLMTIDGRGGMTAASLHPFIEKLLAENG